MIYTLIIVFITIIAFLMVIVVLLQSGQGQGLSGGIGGGAGIGGSSNMMGARRTADFLSKSTAVLATIFLTLCVLANFFIDQDQVSESTIQDRGVPTQTEDFRTQPEAPADLPGEMPAEPAPPPLPEE